MEKKTFCSFLFFMVPMLFFGQQQKKQVLFTVNNEPVYVEAFKRMYLKNSDIIDDSSQMDMDAYLDLYIDYALKVAEAKALHLDEDPSFINEFKKYRNQLAQKYVTETEVTENLIQEAYERMKTAVNVSHILIRTAPLASPADTLKAYERTMDLREKLLEGASFGTLAKKYSEDQSAKTNAGNIGWFTALKMVYPFETAAYETEVGKISMPIRTKFGYHLIKVNDKRPAKGEVVVAHIMLVERKHDSSFNAKERIFELYDQLQEGASFEELAEQFSDDENSAGNGGKLQPFSPGQMNAKKFEEVAFSLKEPNDISEPFQTKFGWHIIKLLEKHPIGSLKEVRSQLETKIKNDSRARLISQSLVHDLRKKFGIEKNTEALAFFQDHVDERITKGTWELDSTKIPLKILIEIKDESKTYLDFANYISKRQIQISGEENKTALINTWFQDFTDNFILKYHKDHLAETNPEFAAIAAEYYNGLLLFDLMEQKIWNAAKKDSLGLQHYFEQHADKYSSKTLKTIRGRVLGDYQQQLEKEWMGELRKKYEVDINRKNVEELKEYFE